MTAVVPVRVASISPSLRDASSLVACVVYREAVRQWGERAVPNVSLDSLPPSITALMIDPDETTLLEPADRPFLYATLTYPPGVLTVSGRLDPAPVEEEIAAFIAYDRSKRWSSRAGLRPGDRVLTVVGTYRGQDAGYRHVLTEEAAARYDREARERWIAQAVRIMNEDLDRIVLARLMGEQVGRVRS